MGRAGSLGRSCIPPLVCYGLPGEPPSFTPSRGARLGRRRAALALRRPPRHFRLGDVRRRPHHSVGRHPRRHRHGLGRKPHLDRRHPGHPERSLLPARHAYNPPKSLNRLLRVDTGAAATLKGNNGANSLGYLSLGGLSGKLEQAGALEIRQDQDIFGSAWRGQHRRDHKGPGDRGDDRPAALSQPGTLNVDIGRLKTDNLQDYRAASKTLGGGTYNLTGTLALPNADVVTNAATLALKGSGAQVDNSSTGAADDGLDNLRSNAASGHVRVLDGKSLTAPKASSPGPFTNTGTLTVGDASTFMATGGLQNNGTLQGSGTVARGGGGTPTVTNAGTVRPGSPPGPPDRLGRLHPDRRRNARDRSRGLEPRQLAGPARGQRHGHPRRDP